MVKKNKLFETETSFNPAMVNYVLYESAFIANKSAASLSGSNVSSTSSFRYENAYPQGLKSTQQLSVDFSKFENHTFFNSAETKVNVGFDKIINEFPFDGSRQESEAFFDSLTGFERYLFDRYPKHMGFLHFSGTSTSENPGGGYTTSLGTHLTVKDIPGVVMPSLAKNKSGKSAIGPSQGSSISFIMTLFVPGISNDNQVIVQKLYNTYNGLTIGLEKSTSTETCTLFASIVSGSENHIISTTTSMEIKKGGFNHVGVIYDSSTTQKNIKLYQSGTLKNKSDLTFFDQFLFANSSMLIGSGTAMVTGSSAGKQFVPVQTLSGAIDELRIFNTTRSAALQKDKQLLNIEAQKNLKLYFKFNEPTGSYTNNDLTIDSSGNSLHAKITNFSSDLRETKGLGLPLINEQKNLNPALFPYITDVINLNGELLSSGSTYDANNPNLITKLLPPHYLQVAQFADGFANEKGNLVKPYATGSIDFPGGGKIGSSQLMSMILFTWAKFFDEIKLFVDAFGDMLSVDYKEDGTIPNQFLPFLGNYYGFTMPNFYSAADFKQYTEGENIQADPGFSAHSLRYVQNQIWRRVLTNLPDILKSKGTIYSVKALIRASGLNPDNNFRFREFGGARSRRISEGRRRKSDHFGVLNFSASFNKVADPEDVNVLGIHTNLPFIVSPFLSASRVEVGLPTPRGTMVNKYQYSPGGLNEHGAIEPSPGRYFHGISNQPADGLFTSGSFTYEAQYQFGTDKFLKNKTYSVTQSLMRMNVTGTATTGPSKNGLIFNLLAVSASFVDGLYASSSLQLVGRSGQNQSDPLLHLTLIDANIFDGNRWYISWGRKCAEEIGSYASASYFLRAGRQSYGNLVRYHEVQQLYRPWGDYNTALNPDTDVLSVMSTTHNVSGSFFTIGSQSIDSGNSHVFLNDSTLNSGDLVRSTRFEGKISNVRFWSKAVNEKAAKEHFLNPRSTGVKDPQKNYNFTTIPTGSFERLRLDVSMNQIKKTSTSAGGILLFDFTQNFASASRGVPWRPTPLPLKGSKVLYAMNGTGFGSIQPVIGMELFTYSYIDPKFDERSTDNKIRVRSWSSLQNEKDFGGVAAPSHSVLRSEEPQDDTRFIIENSVVEALNEDIISIFSTLDEWDNIMGNPEYLFSDDYPDLRILRDIYFERLEGKVRIKEFFEFFRWFDGSIGVLIAELLPRKTDFLGVQFTIESHMLERAKFRYDWTDNYTPIPLQLATAVVALELQSTWGTGAGDTQKESSEEGDLVTVTVSNS